MEYTSIDNEQDLSVLLEDLHAISFLPSKMLSILNDRHYKFYGHYNKEIFIIGATRTSDEIMNVPQNSIFANIKQYGSSKFYKGVVNLNGEFIIPAIYNSIEPFWRNLIKVGRNNKYGIYNLFGTIICPIEYDCIYAVSEYVFGIRRRDKIGFMDTNGKIVIPVEYDYNSQFSFLFNQGKVLVQKDLDDVYAEFSIDHHNNIVDDYKIIRDFNYYPSTFGSGTMYHGDSDILDAYEGDESNRWNTD
mgnify:CR=1 FL=1